MSMPQTHSLAPFERFNWIGDKELEASVRQKIDAGAFSHGWLLTGASGVGKATFAYRVARAILDPKALDGDASLSVDPESQVARLVTGRAHPDLFVAERRWDDKKGRYETEIAVDTIRQLTSFMQRMPGMGDWRVAIIDTADELNRNAANALLKVLEEPPKNTVLMLVSSAPGRLIATIRSRCRRLEFRACSQADVAQFLRTESIEGIEGDVETLAAAAKGRPGYALTLAAGEGAAAIKAADQFFGAALEHRDVTPVVQSLSGKAGDAIWPVFSSLVIAAIGQAARDGAREETAPAKGHTTALGRASPDQLLKAWEDVRDLVGRCDAINLDRAQTVLAMRRSIKRAVAGAHR